jgi:hypothetical protein
VRLAGRDGQLKRALAAAAASINARIRRLLVTAVAASVVLVAFGSTVSYAASPEASTRGDAESVFQAFFTGGSAIRAHNHLAEGAPGMPFLARIYAGEDGLEYCEQGWHVIHLGFFDDPAFFPDGNNGLFDYLSAIDVRYVLDGVPLETERTAIKRLTFPNPAFIEEAFAFAVGAFLPPGSLSVGTHQLQTFIEDPVFGDEDFTISFTVVPC